VNDENGYKKLVVWKKSDALAYELYMMTKKFPREELYGITSQLRRAALSVPTNLAEGCGRQGRKELRQFCNVSLGSLAEVEYLLDFSRRLGYLDEAEHDQFQRQRHEVGALLWNLHRSL